ncbi:sensor histidine kinase [Spirosoma sp. KUDC1026]|uniref:sensor histidine kinase n=1 Tax=Spirosoma sp. KUDC1026 TaxID=2745947 RepID=UPI00159B9822|nr:histidine kinase [Spirosoma sp. KUDC1026]QKZ14849.1 histidine kinase [Spirosoma sp. KUDC1026]
MQTRLTSAQKWQIALYLLGLFTPLLLYINLPDSARSWSAIIHILPFIAVFVLINLGLYYVSITVADWCQRQLSRWLGNDFLTELNGKSFFLTFVVSLVLALLFTQTLHLVLDAIAFVIHLIWPPSATQSKPSPFTPEVLTYIERAHNVFSVVIMLSAFYLTISMRAFQQLRDVQLKAERLEKEALLSQFEALKNQLSPHFLFNSLSILTSLIHEDVNLSEQFIKRLSKAYRYILEQRDQDKVLLKTELDFIQAYTFLLQIRFENKFEVQIDVPPEDQLRYWIAPLTLQLLVENAVKHNRMSLQERLLVRIYTQGDWLVVENPIQARDQPEPSTGVGLRNIVNRYTLLTDQPVTVSQEGNSFIVNIPLLT